MRSRPPPAAGRRRRYKGPELWWWEYHQIAPGPPRGLPDPFLRPLVHPPLLASVRTLDGDHGRDVPALRAVRRHQPPEGRSAAAPWPPRCCTARPHPALDREWPQVTAPSPSGSLLPAP
ncbi:hypothetical protein PAHAL_1G040200 [Panicum hallii]|uniref:Uncharacterized protein n=1 Tax=Panicum hallii TaxID=206008 RepID=A0A2S3GLG5_9POAL|nr:hypothetical protein PAHAL_1G040200 [Panicum hallii]